MPLRVTRLRDPYDYQDSMGQSFAIETLEVSGHSEDAEHQTIINEMLAAVADINDPDSINGNEVKKGKLYFGMSNPAGQLRVWAWRVREKINPTTSNIEVLFLVDNDAFGFPPNTRIVGSRFSSQRRDVEIQLWRSINWLGSPKTTWRVKNIPRPRNRFFKREFVYLENQTEQTIDILAEIVGKRLGAIYAGTADTNVFYELSGASMDPVGGGNYHIYYYYQGEQWWPNIPASADGKQIAVPAVPPFARLTTEFNQTTGAPEYKIELPSSLYWTDEALPNSAMKKIAATGWRSALAPP